MLAYAQRNAPHARIALAIEGGAMQASSWIINSNATVIGMGGFAGSDNAPTVNELANWVATGQLQYVLGTTPGKGGGFFGGGPFGGGPFGGRNGPAGQRDQWVQQHCTVVDPSAYGGSASDNTGGFPFPFGFTLSLYHCAASK
jgi:hypothetical protein